MSFVEGKTFVQRASDLGFEEGVLNTPVNEGDRLGTADGRMEVHLGRGNYLRLDNDSKLDILNLPKKGDDITRLRVWSGGAYIVVGNLAKEKGIEIHTADSSFYILDKGIYRINVRENRDTEILVFHGLVEAAGEGGSTLVKAEQRLEVAEGRFSGKPSGFRAVADDAFDRFNQERNSQVGRQFAKKNLPAGLEDYEGELDANGRWAYVAPYGNVWIPSGVDEDWRPYWNGRWVWLGMSGWTWLPYEPWGWATFHYGRWHWGLDMGWYWIPMAMWGPGWVDWWWDDFYFGWAPLSYWGYPGILMGGNYYGGYYGRYYPGGSRALTVVRRDQLRAANVSRVAVRDTATLNGLSRMSLSNRSLNVRPSGSRISVQTINGNRMMLRQDSSSSGLVTGSGAGRGTTSSVSRTAGQGSGTSTVKREGNSQGGSDKSSPARSSGSSRSSGGGARRIRKQDSTGGASTGSMSGYSSSNLGSSGAAARTGESRAIRTYPSSSSITRPSGYGDGGDSRSRSFLGRSSTYSSSGRSTSSGTRSSVRSGSSSSGKSSGSSRGAGSSHSSGSGGSKRK